MIQPHFFLESKRVLNASRIHRPSPVLSCVFKMDSLEVCEEICGALLQCAVCQSPLKRPKVLPYCSHVFCRGCLESVLRASDGELLCPICRADNTSAVMEGGVDSLVDGHFINTLAEIVNKHQNASVNANRRVLLSSVGHGSTSRVQATVACEIPLTDQGFDRASSPHFQCPVCKVQFHDLDLLQSHVEVCIHDQEEGVFICPNCSNVYLTKDIFTIQAHLVGCMPDVSLDGYHKLEERQDICESPTANRQEWFLCPSCDAICENMPSMEAHVAMHHGQ